MREHVMKKLTKTALKKRLQNCSQGELMDVIQRLYSAVPEAADFLNVEYGDEEYVIGLLDKAKKQVRNEFFPARGLGRLSLSTAKGTIRTFGRICEDPAQYLDLQLYYVECGIEFTNEYGDINEAFYNSMESMYRDVINALICIGDDALTDRFRARLKAAVDDTRNIGWGFHDCLNDAYQALG